MPRLSSCNKLIHSNTVLRYSSNSVSQVFNPSNLHNICKNCGPVKISFSPAISIVTVSNCFSQFSSCSRIGISFHNWLVKRRTFTSISYARNSKPYLVIKSASLHQTAPVRSILTIGRKLTTFIQSLHMERISTTFF